MDGWMDGFHGGWDGWIGQMNRMDSCTRACTCINVYIELRKSIIVIVSPRYIYIPRGTRVYLHAYMHR